MTNLHVMPKRLKTGIRYYVYAWRGGPQIHVQDGTRPVITPDLLDKARQARIEGNGKYAGSFNQVIDDYRASPEFDRLADVTKADYRRWLTRISEAFGKASMGLMGDFRMRKDIVIWRNKWKHQPRAADRAVGTLSTVLAWAAESGLIGDNITTEIGTLHRVDRSDLIWEDHHWDAVKEVPAHIMRALELGKLTGLRLGDLLSLDWAHVFPKAIIIRTSKRKVRAAIPLHRDLKAFLDALPNRKGRVLLNSRGEPWTTDGFKSSWRTARPKGFERHMHDLRGTCATWLAIKGLTDSEIATILGWKASRIAEIRARYVDEARTVVSLAEKIDRMERGVG